MSDPADLIRVLARVRVACPAELQAALGVSQATLSRLVARAGTQIFRMGRGRATQYTRTRVIQGLESPLPIFRVTASGAAVGDLVIGNESLARMVAGSPNAVRHADYPNLATLSAKNIAASSAGGEQPKFGAFAQGRHVLIKFATAADTPAARRWRDLLWCEWKALETVDAAGVCAARAQCVDVEGWRCLEVERFDRIGERGRRAVISLAALDDEHFGKRDNWTAATGRLASAPFSLPSREATQLRWLDVFGQLVGNTDRHFGNITFFVESDGALRLAPVYDMLPMVLAPVNDTLVARDFQPAPPGGHNLDVWSDAAAWAERYWREVQANRDLHDDVRAFAGDATLAVATLVHRVAPGRADTRDRANRSVPHSRRGPRTAQNATAGSCAWRTWTGSPGTNGAFEERRPPPCAGHDACNPHHPSARSPPQRSTVHAPFHQNPRSLVLVCRVRRRLW